MDEHEYEWQTIHKSKANALKALAKHRTGVERELELPNAPGDLEKEAADLLKETRLKNDLKENLRAKMHVANQMHLADPKLPDGPIDLNPDTFTGLYPGEKSNPLDPVAQVTAGLKAMPPPSAFAFKSVVENFVQQKEGLEFINDIREVGGLLRLFALNTRLDKKEGGHLGITLSKIYKNANCKTNWWGKYNSELPKLICPSAKQLYDYYIDGNFKRTTGLKSKIIQEGKMFIFASYATTRNPKVEEAVQELLEMTETDIDLEIRQWQIDMPSVPSTNLSAGGKRKTRKYKKRHVKKSKTRKGKKSRKHKSKTHKRRKHRRGRKSRKH